MTKKSISDEDKALFRELMRSVKPLDKLKKIPSPPPEPPKKLSRKVEIPEQVTRNYNLSNHYQDIVQVDSILYYCKAGIPQKRLKELKSGQIPWQAVLDLHGLRPDAARDTLCEFIDQQYHLNHRCVLIIHGKGSHQGQVPILKNHVNHWLQQLPEVLAFHSALPRHGGAGAVYVLLKRQRIL